MMLHIGRVSAATPSKGATLKKLGVLVSVFVGILSAPMAASATFVSWLFRGELTEVSGVGVPAGINVDDPFSFVLHFDTSTPVTNVSACGDGGVGTRCNHNRAPVGSQYFSDIRLGSFSAPSFVATSASGNSIIVRNNAPDPEGGSSPVDGLTFGSTTDNGGDEFTIFNVILRGPEYLDVVTDGRVLPTDPAANLVNLRTHLFQICDSSATVGCFYADISGRIDSISRVPEPDTYALVAAGLALLTLTLRRRQTA